MVARVMSAGLMGMQYFPVTVEADIAPGMPGFDLVGLPDAAVREAKDRVRSAMRNCGFELPLGHITVNLSPGNVRKSGSLYDLAVLLAVLAASGQIEPLSEKLLFLGELSLSGELRPVTGALAMLLGARETGIHTAFLPAANAAEGSVVEGVSVFAPDSVGRLLDHLSGKSPLSTARAEDFPAPVRPPMPDFADVRGQEEARRALEIAAAGGHNVLLIGPPGSGKSMLAKRLPSILPEMRFDERLQTTMIHSIAGCLPENTPLLSERPFRSPHHTISPSALVGGGTVPRPGELSLAHNGVLFLDELPEFSRIALESLRQPAEDGGVTISRVSGSLRYPCEAMIVCAMNPCPCGYFGHPTRACTCPDKAVSRYLSRISGPLLDRLDLHVEVPPVDFDALSTAGASESSETIRARVEAARKIQLSRLGDSPQTCNARMTPAQLEQFCPLSDEAGALLRRAFDRLGLSARAYHRILSVARTIADLDGREVIEPTHLSEAIQLRSLDRKYRWNGA